MTAVQVCLPGLGRVKHNNITHADAAQGLPTPLRFASSRSAHRPSCAGLEHNGAWHEAQVPPHIGRPVTLSLLPFCSSSRPSCRLRHDHIWHYACSARYVQPSHVSNRTQLIDAAPLSPLDKLRPCSMGSGLTNMRPSAMQHGLRTHQHAAIGHAAWDQDSSTCGHRPCSIGPGFINMRHMTWYPLALHQHHSCDWQCHGL
eukprot:365180-Chlamydomonas_euryale.AAC.4